MAEVLEPLNLGVLCRSKGYFAECSETWSMGQELMPLELPGLFWNADCGPPPTPKSYQVSTCGSVTQQSAFYNTSQRPWWTVRFEKCFNREWVHDWEGDRKINPLPATEGQPPRLHGPGAIVLSHWVWQGLDLAAGSCPLEYFTWF